MMIIEEPECTRFKTTAIDYAIDKCITDIHLASDMRAELLLIEVDQMQKIQVIKELQKQINVLKTRMEMAEANKMQEFFIRNTSCK